MGPARNAGAAPDADVQPTAQPPSDPQQAKTSRKPKSRGSNVFRFFKKRDNANARTKNPHALDVSKPPPPSSFAPAASELPAASSINPAPAPPPPDSTTAASPDDAASQSKQQSVAGNGARTGNDGEGPKRWSVKNILKRRNGGPSGSGSSGSSDRPNAAGNAPTRARPGGAVSPPHAVAEVVLLKPFASLESFVENGASPVEDQPPGGVVLPDAHPSVPEDVRPPVTSLLADNRPLIMADAAPPKTSMLPGARGAPDSATVLKRSPQSSQILSSTTNLLQREIPLRRSSIVPHVSYPILRVLPTPNAGQAANAALQPTKQRSRPLSVSQELGTIVDNEQHAVDTDPFSGSSSTTVVPAGQTSPPLDVASTGRRTRFSTCPDMDVLLHKLSLMESRLRAGDVSAEDPATGEAGNGACEPTTPPDDYLTFAESLLDLHAGPDLEDNDNVAVDQKPAFEGDERVLQTAQSAAPVVTSAGIPMWPLPRPPTCPLPSPPRSYPAPRLAQPEFPTQPGVGQLPASRRRQR